MKIYVNVKITTKTNWLPHAKVPPESILLPITTHLPHFLNKRMPKLQVLFTKILNLHEDHLISSQLSSMKAVQWSSFTCLAETIVEGAWLWDLVGNFRKTPAHAQKGFTGMDRCILKVGMVLQLLSIFFKTLFACWNMVNYGRALDVELWTMNYER